VKSVAEMRLKFILFGFVISLNFEHLFANKICGLRNGTSGFSFGGSEVRRGDWPWTVALIYKPKNSFFCSGSLISAKHVMTGK
jgi:secreted trypsin-like serine protease